MDLFHTDDAAALERDGDLHPGPPGKVRINKRRFQDISPSSNDPGQRVLSQPSSPSEVPSSPPSMQPQDDEATTIEVPTQLNSVAAIEFCGFDTPTARIIWQRERSLPSPARDTHPFIDALLACIESEATQYDAACENDDYRRAFQRFGLEPSLIERLVDPAYTKFLLMQPASQLAQQIVRERYEFLEFGCATSYARQRQRISGTSTDQPPLHCAKQE